MFDIGFSELIVVAAVGCLVLDTKDIYKVIKACKQAFRYFNNVISEFKQIVTDLEQEGSKIIDLDGNEQVTYDLDDISPDIKKDEK